MATVQISITACFANAKSIELIAKFLTERLKPCHCVAQFATNLRNCIQKYFYLELLSELQAFAYYSFLCKKFLYRATTEACLDGNPGASDSYCTMPAHTF